MCKTKDTFSISKKTQSTSSLQWQLKHNQPTFHDRSKIKGWDFQNMKVFLKIYRINSSIYGEYISMSFTNIDSHKQRSVI